MIFSFYFLAVHVAYSRRRLTVDRLTLTPPLPHPRTRVVLLYRDTVLSMWGLTVPGRSS